MLQIGQQAPDFTLYNSEKKEISLKDFRGKKVIIHFYPQAFTGTCTTQLCSMRDDLSYYKNLNAEVLAISVDSVFTLARFKEDQHYNFDLLSDFNKDVSKLYDVLYDEWILKMKGVSKRAAFVIDSEGKVEYAEVVEVVNTLPDFDAIKEAVVKAK